MKRIALILLAVGLPQAPARDPKPQPAPMDATTAFAIANPDENSPFFMDPVKASETLNADYAGQDKENKIADYPQNRNSPGSAAAQVKAFFGDMFSSVNLGPIRTPPITEKLDVEPKKISLQDRREVNVTYTIRNNTKNITRLEYPTSQRIDILTYDAQGNVIDRWSDDRSFEPEEGIVIVNPKERIEYQEKIPTREMKAGETYRVETLTTGDEKFRSEKYLTPQ